jgi:hypothetical protein
MPTKIYDKIKVTGIPILPDLQRWRPNLWSNIDLSIWIKWTLHQDGKSNNAAQDDEQHTTTLGWRNHEEKNLDLCENHLFGLKWTRKWWRGGDFRSKIDPKPPLNEETGRENLEREN